MVIPASVISPKPNRGALNTQTHASATSLAEAMPADKSGLDPATKLVKLREQMAAADGGAGVDAFIVPSEDPHMVCVVVLQ